jgi:hypoxanthine-guanine phosphoribosyltransferase
MTEACSFVAPLARAAKSLQEINFLVASAYREHNMSYSQINSPAVKDEKITNLTKRTVDVMVSVPAAVKKSGCETVNIVYNKKALAR